MTDGRISEAREVCDLYFLGPVQSTLQRAQTAMLQEAGHWAAKCGLSDSVGTQDVMIRQNPCPHETYNFLGFYLSRSGL